MEVVAPHVRRHQRRRRRRRARRVAVQVGLDRSLRKQSKRRHNIANVDEWPRVVPLEDYEPPFCQGLQRELVDEQVKACAG